MTMKPFNAILTRFALIVGVLFLWAGPLAAQTTIDNTTLSGNMTNSQLFITVASVTCTGCAINSNTVLYLDQEALCVNGSYVSGTTLPVTRGCLGTAAAAHNIKNQPNSGNTVVFIGPSNRFAQGTQSTPSAGDPPAGACTRASQQFMPWINVSNGWVWTCDGTLWRATVNFNVNGQAASRALQ